MRRRITISGIWVSLLVACWTPCAVLAERHDPSGIEGHAVVSSDVSLGGAIFGGSPVQARVRVLTARGRFVTSFFTNADGTFKVRLSPGDYLLVPDSPSNPYWHPVQTAVRVQPREITTVTIGYYIPPL